MPCCKAARFALISIMLGALSAAAVAADDKKSTPPAPSQAELEAFMKLSQPGEHHAHLKQMVGTFDVDMEIVTAPGAPPTKSKGSQKSHMLLDGRYLASEYSGDMMGMPFRGMSLMGYDNQKKKFFEVKFDNNETGVLRTEGTISDDGKVITNIGDRLDPVSGKTARLRTVTTIADRDHFTVEWFLTGEDGKEQRTVLMAHTRK